MHYVPANCVSNMVAVCRHGRITNILRVEIAGRLYILLKVNWLTKPTEEQIKAYRRRNSILGPDDLTKTVYTFNPHRDPTAFEKNSEPFILANKVEQQVVVIPHPCMETAVILDPTADFFECLKPPLDSDDD